MESFTKNKNNYSAVQWLALSPHIGFIMRKMSSLFHTKDKNLGKI